MNGTAETSENMPECTRTMAWPWKRATLWLCCLAPFFFLSYGFANWLAAQQTDVGSIVYAWERSIPFLAWTIIPYWSIDALYGLSLFVCTSKAEVDVLGKRLLSAQVIAVMCFFAFPLSFSFDRPETGGLPGTLFTLLEGLDQSFNQAPSLHIALLVILWTLYARHLPERWHWLLHAWFTLIGISVLTTYQHHFIDVPTGALLGWFCIWLWPAEENTPISGFQLSLDRRCWHIAITYIVGSIGFAAAAFVMGGISLWLLWPAISLLLVGAAYAGLGEPVFQKTAHGQMSMAANWLLAPYLFGAWVNSRLWTLRQPVPAHVRDNVWIGRFPSASDVAQQGFASVVDLTVEMQAPSTQGNWQSVPCLDLISPKPAVLREASETIERFRPSGKVLVNCALGCSRSAAAVATWLVITGRSASVEDAFAIVSNAQPHIVLGSKHLAAIKEAARSG